MKIAAAEAQWNTCQPCAVLALPDRRLHRERPDAELLDRDPRPALVPRDRLVRRQGRGAEQAEAAVRSSSTGRATTCRRSRTIYWSMRVMAYAAALIVAARRGRRRLPLLAAQARAAALVPVDAVVATASSRSSPRRRAGCLTEMGRQPWIVQGLLKTEQRELAERDHDLARDQPRRVHRALLALLVVDVWLMRRYAGVDPRCARTSDGAPSRDAAPELLMEPRRALVHPDRGPLGRLLRARGVRLRRRHAAAVPAEDEKERGMMFETIGPVWDGNEVWLVVAGGATFAAFPGWYATMFSGFYLALLLVLVFLIVRVVSFEWRAKSKSPRWRAVWLWANAIGSFGAVAHLGRRALRPPLRRHRSTRAATTPGPSGISSTPYTVFAGLAVVAALRLPRRRLPHAPDDGRSLRTRAARLPGCSRCRRPRSRPRSSIWTVVVAVDRNDKNVFPPVLPAVLGIAAAVLAVAFVLQAPHGPCVREHGARCDPRWSRRSSRASTRA